MRETFLMSVSSEATTTAILSRYLGTQSFSEPQTVNLLEAASIAQVHCYQNHRSLIWFNVDDFEASRSLSHSPAQQRLHPWYHRIISS